MFFIKVMLKFFYYNLLIIVLKAFINVTIKKINVTIKKIIRLLESNIKNGFTNVYA